MRFPVIQYFVMAGLCFLLGMDRVYSEKSIPQIDNLDHNNPQILQLRSEIAVNLKASARGYELQIPLRVLEYRVKKDENFYTIMAKLSQDADTLSSINDLPNPNALRSGQTILVPNARGLFRKKPIKGKLISLNKSNYMLDDMIFYPGEKMPLAEKKMFRGDAFIYPLAVSGRMSSGYGMRRDPFHNHLVFHGGLDIAASTGSGVLASQAGRVIRVQNNVSGYGKLVVIQHEYGYQSWYGHLSRFHVKKGQKVARGSRIAEVGATGRATGPHLHFEIRKHGQKKNPVSLMHRK